MPSPPPEVSIVIPARNAASTLEGTLESIVAQIFGSWEAIVIDDGSTDATASLAGRYARGDSRFSILPGPVRKLGSARNVGLGKAAGRCLLFLDADDTIEPDHLARLTEQLRLRPEADVVCCGWKFASANHTISVEPSADVAHDPFEFLARWCIAPVHAVLVRAPRVREAGGFDEQLSSCQDWDLWQRIARAGASFATVPDVLARYNLRPDSMSFATGVMLEAGLSVIAQAHGPDPRVRTASPANRDGRPSWQLPEAQSNFAMWVAGRAIGVGQDAEPILRAKAVHDLPMSAWRALAQAFRTGLETGLLARDASASADAWIDALRRSVAFVQRLETLHGAAGLARALGTIVEAITRDVLESRTVCTGFVHSVAVEVFKPIEDVVAPPGATLLRAALEIDRAHLGIVELPVCDGCVRSHVLADAIAAEFAYPILGHFLARTLYPQLKFREAASASDDRGKRITCFRGRSPIQTGLSRADCSGDNLHNQVGWTIFLQELWGYPDWPASRFYQDALEPAASDDPSPGRLSVEVSRPLPSVVSRAAHVTVSVGATPFACFALPPEAGDVSADRLLATTTLLGGFELCRIAVRDGIIGRAIDGSSLRARLAERASQPLPAKTDMRVSDSVLTESEARRVLLHSGAPAAGAVLIGGRAGYPLGFSASRRASLPRAAAPAVLEWAAAERLALASTPDGNGTPGWLGYAPDLLGRPCIRRDADESSRTTGTIAAAYDRTVAATRTTTQLPILMYHSVAPDGPAPFARYRVTPKQFESQLRFLCDSGYYSITLERWRHAVETRRFPEGRAIVLTFDNGYLDFRDQASPLLRKYGFGAIVFVVTEYVGRASEWEDRRGAMPLLGWNDIRELHGNGIEFGAQSSRHRLLISMTPEEVTLDLLASRMTLARMLDAPAEALAYPNGAVNGAVRHLAGACGFTYGLSDRLGFAQLGSPYLELPRIEICGEDDFESFVAKLSPGAR